ncbi:MAG TPA: glycosyltransferase [Candidatus Eisenbacteria bacterium]|nr:glycosyltransferase [Candidatus Eisenbacteria bacterium]
MSANRFPVTLGMIVKNEEKLLPQCLETVHRRVAELLIVDTGSTDRTVRIARKFGARVIRRAASKDWTRHRNLYVRHATQPWILSLDADERIAARDVPRIGELIRGKADAYSFRVRNYGDAFNLLRGWHANAGEYPREEKFSGMHGWSTNQVTRLYRNDPRYEHEGVHILIGPSIRRHGGVVREAPFPIHHFECLKGPDYFLKKQTIYYRRTLEELGTSPDPAKTRLDIAIGLFSMGKKDAEAISHLRRALRIRPGYADALKLLAMVYQETGRPALAARHLERALESSPKDPDLHCLLGAALAASGRPERAVTRLKRALRIQRDHPVAWCALGWAHESRGDFRAASEAYRRSLRVLPTYEAPRENLRRLEKRARA